MLRDTKNDTIVTRRSRLYIIAKILDAAINGAVKTRIMYRVNVNFVQFNDYVECLLEAGLIKIGKTRKRTIYKTTEKGKLLLHRFNEVEQMLNGANAEEGDIPLIIKKGSMVYLVKK